MSEVVLETKRLILKLPSQSDFQELLALRTDPEVMRYIGTGVIQTQNQVQEFISNAEPYCKEYGYAFYSVFEKDTGSFVGQAGLFHLDFNINQPDIELAYRLHQKFWQKGYATELAKALIKFGFKHFSLPKIVAIVDLENEASRHVMEKAGMAYQGLFDFRGELLARYEIYNPALDFIQVQLIPASLEQHPIIQNLADYYAYDISEYMGWKQEDDGTHKIGIDFKKYWENDTTHPFLIKYKNELAGFIIIDKEVSNPDNDFNVAQFFVLRKFQRRGLGEFIAKKCLDKFSGKWEVFVMPGNEGSYRFCRNIIKKYTHNQFQEFTRTVNGRVRNVFEFKSRK